MGDKSTIEWTATYHADGTVTPGSTWNPVVGCTQHSPGCDNCYALVQHNRRHTAWLEGRRPDAPEQYHLPFERVQLKPERLDMPLRWRRPRRVFVNSLSDLFHHAVPDEFIDRVFAVMALTPRHTYQVLTKRPKRMRDYCNDPETPRRIGHSMPVATGARTPRGIDIDDGTLADWSKDGVAWPLPNVWLGTSIELDRYAWRANYLRQTPAAVRFISAEPLLGPLDSLDLDGIDWLIVGGESGAGHRPIDPEWVRSLRDYATARGVAFFFKQWGGIRPKAGGRLLDGREWDEMPAGEGSPASRA